GQAEIEENEIVPLAAQRFAHALAVGDCRHFEAIAAQVVREQFPDVILVVDDEQAFCHARDLERLRVPGSGASGTTPAKSGECETDSSPPPSSRRREVLSVRADRPA